MLRMSPNRGDHSTESWKFERATWSSKKNETGGAKPFEQYSQYFIL